MVTGKPSSGFSATSKSHSPVPLTCSVRPYTPGIPLIRRIGCALDSTRSAWVTGPRSTGLPCRSNHGLFSTRPATGATRPAARRRSSHSGTIRPPVEWAARTTGRPGWASATMASARSSSSS